MSPPQLNPNLALHLTDRGLTPLISTSSSSSRSSSEAEAQSLTALTNASLFAYDSASRLGYGLPQRVIVTTNSRGPVVSSSFLNPISAPSKHQSSEAGPDAAAVLANAREALRPVSRATDQGDQSLLANGSRHEEQDDEAETKAAAPLLVATVVAKSPDDAVEARRAAVRLERIGRDFQKHWIADHIE